MNELEQAIQQALQSQGQSKEANKAYLEFIKSNLVVPVEKQAQDTTAEPRVLYLHEGNDTFLPVFSNDEDLARWASEIEDRISLLRLSGVDFLKNVGENITVCLNIGSPYYKEFNPSEIARMRSMVIKLFGKQ